jgi:hypothetical protein
MLVKAIEPALEEPGINLNYNSCNPRILRIMVHDMARELTALREAGG